MKKKCAECGTLNSDSAISCRECGGRVFTAENNDFSALTPSPKIASLIADLNNFGGKGEYAADELKRIGTPVVKPLLQVLASPGSDMQQRRASNILFQMKDPKMVNILVEAILHHPSWSVREEVASILTAAFHWEPENNEQAACLAVIKRQFGRAEQLGLPAIEPLVNQIKQGHGSLDSAKTLEAVVGRNISRIPIDLLQQLSTLPDLVNIEYDREYEAPAREEEHGSYTTHETQTTVFDSSRIRTMALNALNKCK
jgi:hypothetical protein